MKETISKEDAKLGLCKFSQCLKFIEQSWMLFRGEVFVGNHVQFSWARIPFLYTIRSNTLCTSRKLYAFLWHRAVMK